MGFVLVFNVEKMEKLIADDKYLQYNFDTLKKHHKNNTSALFVLFNTYVVGNLAMENKYKKIKKTSVIDYEWYYRVFDDSQYIRLLLVKVE